MESYLIVRQLENEFKINVNTTLFEGIVEDGYGSATFFNDGGMTLTILCSPQKVAEIESAFNQVKQNGGVCTIDVDEGDC